MERSTEKTELADGSYIRNMELDEYGDDRDRQYSED